MMKLTSNWWQSVLKCTIAVGAKNHGQTEVEMKGNITYIQFSHFKEKLTAFHMAVKYRERLVGMSS